MKKETKKNDDFLIKSKEKFPIHQDQIKACIKHLNNILDFNFITRNRKEIEYYGENRSGRLNSKEKIAFKREIAFCKTWLKEHNSSEIENIISAQCEMDLRLYLVRQFIYGNAVYSIL